MAKRKRKTTVWPKLKFNGSAPKLTKSKIEALPVFVPDDVADFLLRYNGGCPERNAFPYPFQYPFYLGPEKISTVEFFYGIRGRTNRWPADDLVNDGILSNRNELPRWSIPIARVDEESFLLVFENGPFAGGVWYFIWIHDHPDDNPEIDPRGALAKVSDSVPEFLNSLSAYSDFFSLVSYVVPETSTDASISRTFKEIGCTLREHKSGRNKYRSCSWDIFRDMSFLDTEIYFVENDRVPDVSPVGIKLPQLPIEKKSQVLHLVVSKRFETQAKRLFPRHINGEALRLWTS